MRLAATLATALLTVVLAAAPAQAQRRAPCSAVKGTTVAKSPFARVVERSGQTERKLIACVRASRRRLLLSSVTDDFDAYQTGRFDRVVLRGAFVAWSETTSEFSCKAACPPEYDGTSTYVGLGDLRARRRKLVLATADVISPIRLSSTGAAAWTVAFGSGDVELHAMKRTTEATLLDRGDIDPASLRVSGNVVSWRKAGELHSFAVS